VVCELGSHIFGRIAIRLVENLHRASGHAEHGKRNRAKREMLVQHHAEKAGYQYLIG
jgi:hypothetical protein